MIYTLADDIQHFVAFFSSPFILSYDCVCCLLIYLLIYLFVYFLTFQISGRLARAGRPVHELDEETRRELEAAASEELLRCLLLMPAHPAKLPENTLPVLPGTVKNSFVILMVT